MLFSNSPEAVKAEVEYRQAKIAEQYRRANRKHSAARETAPKHSSRRLAKVRPA
jgi:hypothetical protein